METVEKYKKHLERYYEREGVEEKVLLNKLD